MAPFRTNFISNNLTDVQKANIRTTIAAETKIHIKEYINEFKEFHHLYIIDDESKIRVFFDPFNFSTDIIPLVDNPKRYSFIIVVNEEDTFWKDKNAKIVLQVPSVSIIKNQGISIGTYNKGHIKSIFGYVG